MARQIEQMDTLFKAPADVTRLRILGLLLAGEVCGCDIHESLKIPQPKASRTGCCVPLPSDTARASCCAPPLIPLQTGH